jgi:hypothetical protein
MIPPCIVVALSLPRTAVIIQAPCQSIIVVVAGLVHSHTWDARLRVSQRGWPHRTRHKPCTLRVSSSTALKSAQFVFEYQSSVAD